MIDVFFLWDFVLKLVDFVVGIDKLDGLFFIVLGYSYGGVIVGFVEKVGFVVDCIFYVLVVGMGVGVSGIEDFL